MKAWQTAHMVTQKKGKKRAKLSVKSEAQRSHAKRRFSERFDYALAVDEYEDMIWKIQHGEAKHLCKQTNRLHVYRVDSPVGSVLAVYDKSRGTITTFLTDDMEARALMERPKQYPNPPTNKDMVEHYRR